jgi:hypothetical protein
MIKVGSVVRFHHVDTKYKVTKKVIGFAGDHMVELENMHGQFNVELFQLVNNKYVK